MDPKQSTKLDPKLQEAFDRVMGTPTSPAGTSPTTAPAQPAMATPQPSAIHPTTPIAAPAPVIKQAMPQMPVQPQIKPIQAATAPTVPTAPHLPGTPIQPPMIQKPIQAAPAMPSMPSTPAMPQAAKPIAIPTPITAAVKPTIPQPAMPTMPSVPQALQHPIPPQITSQPQMQTMHATASAVAVAPAGPHAAGTPTHGFVAPKKKGGISPAILIFGGVVFLLAYTIFWLKFFNVPIPFLTQ